MDLTQTLVNAGSPDPNVRGPAETQLKLFEGQNLPAYLTGLCAELGNESKPAPARQLAGLLLKNAIVAKEESQKAHLAQRWLSLNESVRIQIRQMILQILGSPQKTIRSTASLVVGKVAAIEIPNKSWLDLVKSLTDNILAPQSSPESKESSFEALGYVCEECPEHLSESSSIILNAIASGMKKDEKNNSIKYAATVALANSLDFAKKNFANQQERSLIMQMVFSASICDEMKVRVAAYQCLVEIASSYYEYLGPYMNDIFRLTAGAIKSEKDEVAQQAIEFWSTICDVEMELNEEAAEAMENNQKPERPPQNFMTAALSSLAPLLLEGLTKQSEDIEDETWNVAMASGTCLGLISQTVRDAVVDFVLPFVKSNIQSENWRFREASTLAFGCILDGPAQDKLVPLVTAAFPFIIGQMKDKNHLVKDTAAWTIGRICSLIPEIINESVLPKLMQTLAEGLSEPPKVAANVCWAIHNLAAAAESPSAKASLSKYLEGLLKALLTATVRQDVYEANFLVSAFEAINALIHSAAPDMYGLVGALIPSLLERLKGTLTSQNLSGTEREKQNEVQALLCGALQVIIQKLDENVVIPHADNLMYLFLQVLQSKSATVHEEALMAIGAIANRTNKNFVKYMTAFQPFLVLGLKNAQEHHVCIVSVGVVGDISRALEEKMIPFCDEIMNLLLQNLQNPAIERSVKPHIISCLGDVAMAVGGYFERYLPYVMMMLVQASTTTFDSGREEDLDYLNTLRESIFEAYTGILQGLSGENKAHLFLPFVDKVVPFLDLVASDDDRADEVLRTAVGVIGDLATRLGDAVTPFLKRSSVINLVKDSLESDSESTVKGGEWSKAALDVIGLSQ